MLTQKQGAPEFSSCVDGPVCERVRELIADEQSLVRVSVGLGVNLAPLRKILERKPVSKYFLKRMSVLLEKDLDPEQVFLDSPEVKRLLWLYRLYQRSGSLEKVGRQVGLSRERVRQLLEKGTRIGLFRYKTLYGLPIDSDHEPDRESEPRLLVKTALCR